MGVNLVGRARKCRKTNAWMWYYTAVNMTSQTVVAMYPTQNHALYHICQC